MHRLMGFLGLVLAVQVGASEIGVKSLSGPPDELSSMRLPSVNELMTSSNVLMIDQQRIEARADAGSRAVAPTTTNFSVSEGTGFSLVQVTSAYPQFATITINGPNGNVYRFNGTTLTCSLGPCGEYQANLDIEAFNNQPGGIASMSISGGEVLNSGVWGLAITYPIATLNPVQIDTMVAYDENYVDVGIDPDPCLVDPNAIDCIEPPFCEGICPQPLMPLVEGDAPWLAIAFPEPAAADDAKEKQYFAATDVDVIELKVQVMRDSDKTLVYQDYLGATRAMVMPRNAHGQHLLKLPPLSAGLHSVRLDVKAEIIGRGVIERTVFYPLQMIESRYALKAAAYTQVMDHDRLQINLAIDARVDTPSHLYAYAEVWSRQSKKPLAWIGGMTYPRQDRASGYTLPMVFDARWLVLAGDNGSDLVLRNIRIQDPDTMIPYDQMTELPLAVNELPAVMAQNRSTVVIDETLYFGKGDISIPVASTLDERDILGTPTNTGVFLVHGWCTGPSWPVAHFNDGPTRVFQDITQSRTHDAFAIRIRDQGNALFTNQFAIVAHSQGGAAATHLRAFYTSRLDNSTAPRRIQSLGTPYGGAVLMDYYVATGPFGWLIGWLFSDCLPTTSLTSVGSALWRASIPNSVRNQVFYYRTRHRRPSNFWQRLQFWRWKCGITSYVIGGNDDGVVSISEGDFSGARNMGITDGQCHIDDMRYGDQKEDLGRNQIMDREARPATGNLARTATTSASSTYCASGGLHCYSAARVNDGSRDTALGGYTSWTNSSTTLPQWVELRWTSNISASRVDVYTSSGYPIQDYDVQYWTGSSWATRVAVRGNTSLSRSHTFATVTTTRMRILGLRGPSNQPQYVRVNEFEVYP
ncbi:MAG: hypothetical protein Tsb002_19320 [Wenzhouxiangellaceae bacterium]